MFKDTGGLRQARKKGAAEGGTSGPAVQWVMHLLGFSLDTDGDKNLNWEPENNNADGEIKRPIKV